jgi:hypothetical protein
MLKIKKQTASRAKGEVVGSVRQSQLMSTFGIGSMIDFVDNTAMILGTDFWNWANSDTDNEYRLNNKNLETLLGVKYFIRPKTEKTKAFKTDKSFDVEATIFPKMLYCLHCKRLMDADKRCFSKGKLKCSCGHDLVPSRFVAVCQNGHIEDFPYSWWVHGGDTGDCICSDDSNLKMYYINNRSDMASLFVECEICKKKRSMRNASAYNALANYKCKGNRPWLGDGSEEECDETLRLCMRTESNVYFAITQSALTIPPFSSNLAVEIQKYLGLFSGGYHDAQRKEIIGKILGKKEFKSFPPKYIEDLFIKLEKKADEKTTLQSIMEEEYFAFSQNICDENSDNFVTRNESIPQKYSKLISKVVAVDRLTVVTALTGFTRLRADGTERLAPLSVAKKEWFPAIEQKGEGIFIEFDSKVLNTWRKHVGTRYAKMQESLAASMFQKDNFSPQYVFLHTFAHLFMRELSNLCGYSVASMQEKIYSTYKDGTSMCGVLIYTSSADADGSLGGLVEQAKEHHMESTINALVDRGDWCSMDPICVTSQDQGMNALNYAACYACTLIPETSCEFRNVLLDRVAVVGTAEDAQMGVVGWI